MSERIQQSYNQIIRGQQISRETAVQLASCPDQPALWAMADAVRRHCMGERFHLCSIINARSGNCTEDCRFCAQSARCQSDILTYTSIDPKKALAQAQDNDKHGVDRLSLVTSGRAVDQATLEQLAASYGEIARQTSMELCASMGFVDDSTLERLRSFGVSRYHCNLEACRDFFPTVCTTHTWEEKTATLQRAGNCGMSLCSGGIIGMGENMDDRIALACELRALNVLSIPINILTPIDGTPMATMEPLPVEEVLTTIALFRLINPDAVIRMAGGRQQLGAEQYRCFAAGANGAIVGNYLTTVGSSINDDLRQLAHMGFSFKRSRTPGG